MRQASVERAEPYAVPDGVEQAHLLHEPRLASVPVKVILLPRSSLWIESLSVLHETPSFLPSIANRIHNIFICNFPGWPLGCFHTFVRSQGPCFTSQTYTQEAKCPENSRSQEQMMQLHSA